MYKLVVRKLFKNKKLRGIEPLRFCLFHFVRKRLNKKLRGIGLLRFSLFHFVQKRLNKKVYSCMAAALTTIALFAAKVQAFAPENEKEVKEKLSKILASGEFGDKKKTKTLLQILHEKFIEFIKKIWEKLNIGKKLESVFGASKVSPEVMFLLKILAIVLMVAVVVIVVYLVTRKITHSRKVRQEEDALLLDVLKDPDEVYKKAFEYYKNGDYTQGLRFLYISLLIRFNELDIIRINKAKTNKQYLLEIRDNKPEIQDVMTEFTQVFNRHWYGGRNVEKEVFVSWSDVYNTLMGFTNKA